MILENFVFRKLVLGIEIMVPLYLNEVCSCTICYFLADIVLSDKL